jgi:catechol 2,3-dioxygenase-like lactoylglutathione lyase family enzyme
MAAAGSGVRSVSGLAGGLGGAEARSATSLATEEGFGLGRPGEGRDAGGKGIERVVSVAEGPALSTAIVNCRDLATTRAFYRDRVGLHVKMDSPWWVELDAGRTNFALHPWVDRPEAEMHHSQPVTLGFAVDDLRAWSEVARERGVAFLNAPIDEGFGLTAEATDPEGNVIVFREPAEDTAVEEQLAERFEHDDPRQVPIRKTVKKGVKAVSRLVLKPEYKTREAPRKTAKARKSAKKGVHSTRGAGPAGTRLKPKRAADPKRARNRPAVGRLKKAERRTSSRKKSAVAGASKGKPVKRKVARRVARGKRR